MLWALTIVNQLKRDKSFTINIAAATNILPDATYPALARIGCCEMSGLVRRR